MYIIIINSWRKARNLLNMKRDGILSDRPEKAMNCSTFVRSYSQPYSITRQKQGNMRSKDVRRQKDYRFVIACPQRDGTIMKWYVGRVWIFNAKHAISFLSWWDLT